MRPAKRVAVCGLTVALAVTLLFLGGVIGVGTYMAPILASLCLIPAGRACGLKYHLLMWAAASALCLILVPDLEEGLMFLAFYGWYPAVRPKLEPVPQPLRWVVKLLLFNVPVIAVQALLIFFLLPGETDAWYLLLVFWLLFNLIFWLFDRLLPGAEAFYERRLRHILHPDR